MSIYLSKSDFKVARTCATKLYYKKLGYPSIRDDDEYLQLLADGGYMIETIAKLCYPDGIEIGFDQGPEASAEETMRALQAHTVTVFEATLISNGRLARVDILKKTGNVFELIEVKAKSVDSSKGDNPFRGKREGIKPKWRPYLEDVAFQVVVLRDLFPAAEIVPYLCLTDRSKTTSIDQIFARFQLARRQSDTSKFQRPTVSYTGDPDELRKEPFLTVINIADEVRELLPEVEKISAVFVESLQTGVVKIPVAINVDCRSCEYRFVNGRSTGQVEPTKNGFKECWGGLADENPHILDYYHVGSIGSRNHRLADTLISRGRARMADIEEVDLGRIPSSAL